MRKIKKSKKGRVSTAAAVMTGTAITTVVSILMIAAVSALMLGGVMDTARIKPAAYGILLFSTFIGTMTAARNAESYIAIVVAAVAAVYFFVLITINIILYQGAFDHFGISLGITVIPAVISALLTTHRTKGKRKRYTRAY